ncbi:ATP-binding protein [Actinomadura scrupuli]|uniref:ATP-binding protein n=1 Tax=Actinomadura scrupuli TaxID=559629 RepID=UPI003D9744B0
MTHDLRISLLATKAAAGLARTLAETRLYKWGLMDMSGDALLVITELVTNAIAETPHREIRFRLARDGAGILIAVWDSSPRPPVARPVTEPTLETLDLREEHWDDNGGWGLALVQALSADCGCTPDPAGGKWAWARLKP